MFVLANAIDSEHLQTDEPSFTLELPFHYHDLINGSWNGRFISKEMACTNHRLQRSNELRKREIELGEKKKLLSEQ